MSAKSRPFLWLREVLSIGSSGWPVRIFFVVAAVLSVVLIPLSLIFFEGGARNYEALSWVAASASLVIAFFSFLISYGSVSRYRKEEELAREAAKTLLIREVAAIQELSQKMFPGLSGKNPIAVRGFLRDNNIWTQGDVVLFDEALRVRNDVVHAAKKGQEESVVSEALNNVRDLRLKIAEADVEKNDSMNVDVKGQGFTEGTSSWVGSSSLREVRFITVAEVATIMKISKMTAYRMVHAGVLPAIRVGRSYRVPERAVYDYLDSSMASDVEAK